MSSAALRFEVAGIVAAAVTKSWLVGFSPVAANGLAGYDDVWFLRKARSLLDGHWLGQYDHLTLIKGPAYPMWIAFTSSLRLPLLFAQQALYVIAAFILVRAVAPLIRSPLWRLALFVVVVFNPMTFADDMPSIVSREHFTSSMALLIVASGIGALFRLDRPLAQVLPWLILCGFAFSAFWHVREEGVWIVPFAACILLAVLLNTSWKRTVLIASVPLAMFAAAHAALVVANGIHYGIRAVVEFKEKSFVRAYGTLTGARQYPTRPRIPMPRETRERVYAVSPAFAELRPFLEGDIGARWARLSGPQADGDIGGAFFMWAFREAVQKAGYYDRGGAAVRAYYDRITREVEAARGAGRLQARGVRATLMPPILKGQRQQILRTWARALYRIVAFTDFVLARHYTQGSPAELRDYELAHTPLAPRKQTVSLHLTGYVFHRHEPVELTVEDRDGNAVSDAKIARFPSPDLYSRFQKEGKDFPPAKQARFDLRVPAHYYYLTLSVRGRPIERIPLRWESPTAVSPDVQMAVERFSVDIYGPPRLHPRDWLRMNALGMIGRVYQRTFPIVFGVAMLLFVLTAPWRRRSMMTPVILGLLASVAARAMILSIIDVTAFFVFTPSYQAPAHGLVLAATMLALSYGGTAVRDRIRATATRDQ